MKTLKLLITCLCLNSTKNEHIQFKKIILEEFDRNTKFSEEEFSRLFNGRYATFDGGKNYILVYSAPYTSSSILKNLTKMHKNISEQYPFIGFLITQSHEIDYKIIKLKTKLYSELNWELCFLYTMILSKKLDENEEKKLTAIMNAKTYDEKLELAMKSSI